MAAGSPTQAAKPLRLPSVKFAMALNAIYEGVWKKLLFRDGFAHAPLRIEVEE